MSNGFKLIKANNSRDADFLASMHNLRYEVFCGELKWSQGLDIVRYMEFDEYDCDGTDYIIHVNNDGKVDAACRLIPTSRPYMIADHYPEFVNKITIPNSDEVWEISRFCASAEARKSSAGKIAGQVIAAAIEFGISRNIKNYVALATDKVVPVIRRVAGWDPVPIGDLGKTPDDHSYSVIYTVSTDMLQQVRRKNGINKFLLFDIKPGSENLRQDYNIGVAA